MANDVVYQGATFSITNPKLYVLVVTLSIQNNVRPPQQLKSAFKIAVN